MLVQVSVSRFDRLLKFCREQPGLPIVALGPACFALWALQLGQDINWDLRNYHYYNVFAWIHGRYETDVAPGYMCSYYNSTLFAPRVVAMSYLSPKMLAVATAGIQGSIVYVVYWFGQRLLPIASARTRSLVAAGLAYFGATGALVLSQLGTSFIDSIVALIALVGFGLCFLGGADSDSQSRYNVVRLVAGAVVLGLLTGMRPQAIIYGFGALVGLALSDTLPKAKRLGGLAIYLGAYGLAGIVGLMPWGLTMWRVFGNPLFPMLNSVFQSPYASQVNPYAPAEYVPDELVEWLFLPFVGIYDSRLVNDLPHFDLRWPVLYGATLLSLLALLLGRRWRGDRRSTAVLWAFLGTYLLLLARFTRYRYGLGIEVVAPLLCVLVLDGFWQLSRSGAAALGVLAVVVLGTTQPVDWGRVPFKDTHFPHFSLDVPDDAALLVTGRMPMAFLVAQLPDSVPLWRITEYGDSLYDPQAKDPLREENPDDKRLRQKLEHHAGPLYLAFSSLSSYDNRSARAALRRYGLQIDSCRWLPFEGQPPLSYCALRKVAPARP